MALSQIFCLSYISGKIVPQNSPAVAEAISIVIGSLQGNGKLVFRISKVIRIIISFVNLWDLFCNCDASKQHRYTLSFLFFLAFSRLTFSFLCLSQQLFVICPSTVKFNHPNFKLLKQIYPHLSMEDPPDLTSFFKADPEETWTCRSGNQGGDYLDPTLSTEHCARRVKETLKNGWRVPGWRDFTNWIYSELSLNSYQYVQNNSNL